MSSPEWEALCIERETYDIVKAACDPIIPGCEIRPSMFDAGVFLRHGPGDGPTLADADRIASVLRAGRPLVPDRADWHVSGFGPYGDAVDPSRIYGTSFGLRRAFLPTPTALLRAQAGE